MKSENLIESQSAHRHDVELAVPLTVQHAVSMFMEHHSARNVSRNLRSLLLQFLQHEQASECLYLKDLTFDLEGLFALLETLEECQPGATAE